MNKHIFIFTLIVTSLLGTTIRSEAQIYLGLHGGANLSSMQFTNNFDYRLKEINYIQGINGGFVFQYLPQEHTGLQVEINYSERGWSDQDDSVKYTRSIDYMEMPFLSHFNIGGGKFRFTIDLGFYVAYALSSFEEQTLIESNEFTSGEYELIEGRDNVWDFGILGGGGFEYRIGDFVILARARYAYGLGNIFAQKEVLASEISQNRVISINLGLLYKFSSLKK